MTLETKLISIIGALLEHLETASHNGTHEDCQVCLDVQSAKALIDRIHSTPVDFKAKEIR